MAPKPVPANRKLDFKTNLLKGSILKVEINTVGTFWAWAEEKVERLYNTNKTALSEDFVANVQPLFDSLKLNVSLPRVKITFGAKSNFTVGYEVSLMTTTDPFPKQLGTLLHELGHIVQFVNAPRSKWQHKKNVTIKDKSGELHDVTVSDWDAKIVWMNEENGEEMAMSKILYHDESLRYDQDPYIKAMPLAGLLATYLLVEGYSLDAPANRFSDLLRCWHGSPPR